MNDNTRVVVFCYQGDQDLVHRHLPTHQAHGCPITVMSPADSPVSIIAHGVDNRLVGKRAYIGRDSLERHRGCLSVCLEYPENYFLLHDADSLCLSPELPRALFDAADNEVVWSNEVVDPRPHETPYRKIAMQPPYFLTRHTIYRILVAPQIPEHPVTPYIDWWWTAHCWSAGVSTKPFADCEYASPFAGPLNVDGYWGWREHMIRDRGCIMQHPIKTQEEYDRTNAVYANRVR